MCFLLFQCVFCLFSSRPRLCPFSLSLFCFFSSSVCRFSALIFCVCVCVLSIFSNLFCVSFLVFYLFFGNFHWWSSFSSLFLYVVSPFPLLVLSSFTYPLTHSSKHSFPFSLSSFGISSVPFLPLLVFFLSLFSSFPFTHLICVPGFHFPPTLFPN